MESGDRVRVKTAIPPALVEIDHREEVRRTHRLRRDKEI